MKKLLLSALPLLMLSFSPLSAQKHTTIDKALGYLGKPYVAQTLERSPTEQLIINKDSVDCTTFVEYVMAESLAKDESTFPQILQQLRYRNGKIDGYTSRLHYMTEWTRQAIANGWLEDITAQQCPHDSVPIQLSFMSSHSDKYPLLKGQTKHIQEMKHIEQQLSNGYVHYLPKNKLSSKGESWIEDGDLLLLVTNIKGLDVTHVGWAKYVKGQLHLLHASSTDKKVEISKRPLSEMLQQSKNWIGIRVFRLKEKQVYTTSQLHK